MRLANGIVLEKDATFGELKFSALRREVRIQNEDGSVSDEIKERTYDLKSKGQGRMIQVSIPASVPLKEFDYNAGSYITHIGIYLGDNRMFHAGDPIGYADLTSSYWQQHLVGAGRIKQ